MKIIFMIIVLNLLLFSKIITTNEVYSQTILLQDDIHYILNSYGIKHDHAGIIKRVSVNAILKPRNVYQKTYEIMIKENILRVAHGFVETEPTNIAPTLHLNPDLVYEQVRRLLTEFRLFEIRSDIKQKSFKPKIYRGKSPIDVFNALSHISAALDELNGNKFTPSYVFAQNMRVFSDITLIINRLNIVDDTIPSKINKSATPEDTFATAMRTLDKIKELQILSGIDFVDFSAFEKDKYTPSEVFTITQMIISELQTLKAYLKIEDVTLPSYKYTTKTPVEVDQLMNWNLRKLNLIKNINVGR